jgi:hypothetical protein
MQGLKTSSIISINDRYHYCCSAEYEIMQSLASENVGSNPVGGMDICCECCVLSGRGLCDELITRPEESYRLWCVVCDLGTSKMRRSWTGLGSNFIGKKTKNKLFALLA